jgi:hypothetical protein
MNGVKTKNFGFFKTILLHITVKEQPTNPAGQDKMLLSGR